MVRGNQGLYGKVPDQKWDGEALSSRATTASVHSTKRNEEGQYGQVGSCAMRLVMRGMHAFMTTFKQIEITPGSI
jgi:hypothetical protein